MAALEVAKPPVRGLRPARLSGFGLSCGCGSGISRPRACYGTLLSNSSSLIEAPKGILVAVLGWIILEP